MKQLLLVLFVLPFIAFSQCPPSGSFNSQAEIDAFATDYPDCTILSGSLTISGDDITDLSGLYQIVECTSLGISGNPLLQNINGLNPNIVLSYVEGTGNALSIINNTSLVSIDGLQNLVNNSGFESDIRVMDNPMLASLVGLPNTFNALSLFFITNNDSLTNLNGIGNYGAELINIDFNDGLLDLSGYQGLYAESIYIRNNNALQSLGDSSESSGYEDYLYIENNPILTDISGINAGGYGQSLIIRNNPNLSICNSESVCQYIYINGIEEGSWFPGTFENNAPGCNTNIEVEYGCELNSNDNCGGSTPNLILGETIQANNEFATTSFHVPSCNEVVDRQDIWFLFDSGASTSVDVFVEAGFNLQMWEGTCYSDLAHVDNACNSGALNDIIVIPNTLYYLQVWDDGTGRRTSGWFDLTVQDGLLSTPEFEFDAISIYPNPAQNELHIQSNTPIDTVQMFNLLGQQILERKATTLDISNLTDGLYLVKVFSNGKESTYKIVKQ
jgi:hypothetical protein